MVHDPDMVRIVPSAFISMGLDYGARMRIALVIRGGFRYVPVLIRAIPYSFRLFCVAGRGCAP